MIDKNRSQINRRRNAGENYFELTFDFRRRQFSAWARGRTGVISISLVLISVAIVCLWLVFK